MHLPLKEQLTEFVDSTPPFLFFRRKYSFCHGNTVAFCFQVLKITTVSKVYFKRKKKPNQWCLRWMCRSHETHLVWGWMRKAEGCKPAFHHFFLSLPGHSSMSVASTEIWSCFCVTLGWIHLESCWSWLLRTFHCAWDKQCCHGISIPYPGSQVHHPKLEISFPVTVMQPTLGKLFMYSRVHSGADKLQGMASSLTAFKHNIAISYFSYSLVNQIQPSLNLHLLVLTVMQNLSSTISIHKGTAKMQKRKITAFEYKVDFWKRLFIFMVLFNLAFLCSFHPRGQC